MDGHVSAGYEEDFYAWTQAQAAALRAEAASRSNAPVDWENVAEEIACMGRSEKREIQSRLQTIIVHLMKWLYCLELRERCENDWRTTIRTQRFDLADALAESPSLHDFPGEVLEKVYQRARPIAAHEADVPLKTFPKIPPFTIDQVLNPQYPSELFPAEDDE